MIFILLERRAEFEVPVLHNVGTWLRNPGPITPK